MKAVVKPVMKLLSSIPKMVGVIVASVLGFLGRLMAPLSGLMVLVSSLLASVTGLVTMLVNSVVRIVTTLVGSGITLLTSLMTPWGLAILMILTGTSFMFWMKYMSGAKKVGKKDAEKEISEAIFTSAQDFSIRGDANLMATPTDLDSQFPKIDF